MHLKFITHYSLVIQFGAVILISIFKLLFLFEMLDSSRHCKDTGLRI